jgi:hypothetical protein
MSKTKNKITIDIPELEKDVSEHPAEVSVTKPIAYGVLKDGRNYQVQVTITTDEDEFIDE